MQFTDGYVTAAYCNASRAGLMTGRYQTRFGYEFNPTGHRNEDPDFGLPASQKTIADQLQLAGYTTALIGKWHLGGTAAYHPFRRDLMSSSVLCMKPLLRFISISRCNHNASSQVLPRGAGRWLVKANP